MKSYTFKNILDNFKNHRNNLDILYQNDLILFLFVLNAKFAQRPFTSIYFVEMIFFFRRLLCAALTSIFISLSFVFRWTIVKYPTQWSVLLWIEHRITTSRWRLFRGKIDLWDYQIGSSSTEHFLCAIGNVRTNKLHKAVKLLKTFYYYSKFGHFLCRNPLVNCSSLKTE